MKVVACLFVVLVASTVTALDCDALSGQARTDCLDKAADQNIQMAPAESEADVEKQQQLEADEVHTSEDAVDDVMGDLGEANKATAKTGAEAEMQTDLEEAKRKT